MSKHLLARKLLRKNPPPRLPSDTPEDCATPIGCSVPDLLGCDKVGLFLATGIVAFREKIRKLPHCEVMLSPICP